MCQTTLDIIFVHDYSLDRACYNDGNGVECKCRDMYIHQNYLYIVILYPTVKFQIVEFYLGTCHFPRFHDIELLKNHIYTYFFLQII